MHLAIAHTEEQLAAAVLDNNHNAGTRAIVTYLRSHGHQPTLRQAATLYKCYQQNPDVALASITSFNPANSPS